VKHRQGENRRYEIRDPSGILPRISNLSNSHSSFSYLLFFRGTLAPARLASDSPIAIACLRLVTFFPERPLFKVPRLRSCIALLTFCAAFFPYLAMVIPPLVSDFRAVGFILAIRARVVPPIRLWILAYPAKFVPLSKKKSMSSPMSRT
jgi:hypothetical protein